MTTMSSICPSQIFSGHQYLGEVQVNISEDLETSSFLIEAQGERITLRTFQGPYLSDFQDRFGDRVRVLTNEFEDMKAIFGDAEAKKNYSDCKPQSDEKIEKRIEFNARRALEGNPFTGFAIVDNLAQKIIGFVSIGRGFNVGDSQSALILNPNYTGKKLAREAAILAASIAHIYFIHHFKVGSKRNPVEVKRFTATVKDYNENAVRFLESLGLSRVRALTSREAYTDDPASLYAIDGDQVLGALSRHMDLSKFSWTYEKIEQKSA